MKYHGSCHCGDIKFEFETETISKGLRCNCSVCTRKGALMSAFVLSEDELKVDAKPGSLSTYTFGTGAAKHQFCNHCGIYTFHETMRFPGKFRVNLGCVEGLDSLNLPFDIFDGASL